MKICQRKNGGCGTLKPVDAFHKNPHNKDGRSNVCASCTNENNRLKEANKKRLIQKRANAFNAYAFMRQHKSVNEQV